MDFVPLACEDDGLSTPGEFATKQQTDCFVYLELICANTTPVSTMGNGAFFGARIYAINKRHPRYVW